MSLGNFQREMRVGAMGALSRHQSSFEGVDRSEEVGFADYLGGKVCFSRAGRYRRDHVWDRDRCCIFCDLEESE